MEKLKLYFNDNTTYEFNNDSIKFNINSVINGFSHNINVTYIHRVGDLDLLLKEIYLTNIKGKTVVKAELFIDDMIIDDIVKDNLSVSWNLGGNIVAGENVYIETIVAEDN